jgi:type III secretory pathway component EscU
VAIRFEPDDCPLPLITAKAQGADAQRLREAARDANVPIVRNIPLARELNFRADYDDVIPEDLFEPVAEVLAWAQRVTRDFERDPSVSLYRDTQ